jgi:hypothetical protein
MLDLPALLRRQSVQHFHAPPQEIRTERKSNQNFDKLNDQFGSGHSCYGGSYFGPTETMILMSEVPGILFNMPDTWIAKESSP